MRMQVVWRLTTAGRQGCASPTLNLTVLDYNYLYCKELFFVFAKVHQPLLSMKKILFFVLTLFISSACFSQDFSNKGKDFWISYPAHIDGATSVMGIYITSDVDATGTINVAGNILSFSLKANNVVRKFIGPNGSGDAPNTSVYLSTSDGISPGAGIHVISDKPVAVYAHIIKSARSAATLVLPTNVWGKNYIVPGYKSEGQQKGYGEITIMAKLPNTTVEITPKITSLNGIRSAGIPFQIKLLAPGDVYQLQFTESADLSGTMACHEVSGSK